MRHIGFVAGPRRRQVDRGISRSADPGDRCRPYHEGVLQWYRSILREPAIAGAPARSRRDIALVGLAEAGAVVETLLRPDLPLRWPTLALAIVVLPALLWRRSHPLVVTAASFGAMNSLSIADLVIDADQPTGLGTMVVLLLSLYALFRWASGRDMLIGLGVVLATATVSIAATYTGLSDAIGGYIVLAITIAIALAVRFRNRSRQREIEQVRLVEREQLARDLHDTVAHHVSAIAIRAQAGLAVAGTRPDAALEALELIGAEASRTLAEMRAMVGVLRRDQQAELAPTPSLADVERLARHTGHGPVVDVSVAEGLHDVAPAVATAVYRIAQEAVTNAQRHAHGVTRIVVAVTGDDTHVGLRVVDDGTPVDTGRIGDGYGIRGMVERAQLLGGTCAASPRATGGWIVEAELPRTAVDA